MATLVAYADMDTSWQEDQSSGYLPEAGQYYPQNTSFRLSVVNDVKSGGAPDCGEMFRIPITALPAGATISSVYWEQYQVSSDGWSSSSGPPGSASELSALYPVTSSWSEAASHPTTGLTAPSVTSTNAFSVYKSMNAVTSQYSRGWFSYQYSNTNNVGSYYDEEVAFLNRVQAWYAGTATNYGWWWAPNQGEDDKEGDESAFHGTSEGGTAHRITITFTVVAPTTPGAWTNPTVDVTQPQNGTNFVLNWGDSTANGGPAINNYRIEYAYKVNSGDAWGSWVDWTWVGSATSQYNWSVGTGGSDGYYKFRVRAWNGYTYSAYGAESAAIRLVPSAVPANASNAGGSGGANTAGPSVGGKPTAGSGVGTSNVAGKAIRASAGVANAAGASNFARASLRINSGVATGTAVAQAATFVARKFTYPPEAAIIGVALAITPRIRSAGGLASGVGAANAPNANAGARPSVGSSVGTANNTTTTVRATAGVATASGVANRPPLALVATIAVATSTGTAYTVTALVQVTLRPNEDIVVTGWTTQLGGTTNLYAVLDEIDADDADYVTAVISA